MGSIRWREVLFKVRPRDHETAPVPHVHAWIGSGEVTIELMPDRTVRISRQHRLPVRGRLKRSEITQALDGAVRCYDLLIAELERQR
jgi:hypothetical protein